MPDAPTARPTTAPAPRGARALGLFTLSLPLVLERAAKRLADRIADLEVRLEGGDEAAWMPYMEALKTLAAVAPQLAPERRGALLTTAQLAERLNVSPKTVLKRKARGELRPAIARGKFIRWRGDEGKALTPPNGRVTDR